MRKANFDVVVVGAGFGGMCAAARLVHRGYKTLLPERLSLLGGRCSTLDYEGFKLTTGAVAVPSGGVIEETFREVDAEFNVRSIDPPSIYRIEGKDYEWPIEEGLAKAIYEFSRDKDGANRVLEAIARAVEWQPPAGTISLKEWLSQYTEDERIYQVFQPFCIAVLGVNIYGLPASEFFAWISRGLQAAPGTETLSFAAKGNLDLVESLARGVGWR